MPESRELDAERLTNRCDPSRFDFETTAELEPLTHIVGQPRAVESVRFAVDIDRDGYNIFAIGPPGTGKRTLVQEYLERRACEACVPDDWCYVNNFEERHKPVALRLPPGRGRALRDDVDQLVEDACKALARVFDSDEYREQLKRLEEEVSSGQKESFEKLREKAKERGLDVVQTEMGMAFVPVTENGETMSSEEINQLSEQDRKEYEEKAGELEEDAQALLHEQPRAQRRAQRKLRELNERVAERTLAPLFDDLQRSYSDENGVREFLGAVRRDMVHHSQALLEHERSMQQERKQGSDAEDAMAQRMAQMQPVSGDDSPLIRRYRVNVIVGHEPSNGCPVLYEDNPTYQNVLGRTEHMAQMGALVTDFNMIKAGALHRANGGYLMLDAHRVLAQPLVWEALKRALRGGRIRIESPGEAMGMVSTTQLEPEPIPLDVKVVLFGSRMLYSLLREYDPDFAELFKVPADFEDVMERSEESEREYTRVIATLAQKDGLRPFGREAVAAIIELSSRMSSDSERLSVHMRRVADLLMECDYWAGQRGAETVGAGDVRRAREAQIHRTDRIRERLQEEIARGTMLIDTAGEHVGQVNGLAVVPFGDFHFGRPMRITARVRMGKGDVVDIEREVELGGPIHSKGVLILSGFLSGRYASDQPLSLSASLVFEQSYGGIGGDSASSAELYALLSAIADVPIRQSIAVTGSVNQHGGVQAIGGVNEKIEGFFDVCAQAGLSGDQGVIIPSSNVKHLMLREDVIGAVREGRFHVWSVDTIDEGIELLTGVAAGEPDASGAYPPETINGKVRARLASLTEKRLKLLARAQGGDGE